MSGEAGEKDGEDGRFDAFAKGLFELWERHAALQGRPPADVLPGELSAAVLVAALDALKLWLLAAAGHPPSPAAEFSSPGFSLRSAALGALWQAAAAHWIPFLTERQAGAALAAVLVLHGAAVDVHSWWAAGKGKGKGKRTFDFTAGPARLLHAVSGVPPVPASSAGGARGGAGEKKKAATAAAAVTAATAATGARSATRKKSA